MDLDDREFLARRTWRWFKVRVEGLMYEPSSRLHRGLDLEGGSNVAEGR